ncbi:MAG: hypothetical protein JRN26_06565 [Nitrososphaerota archaeon]|jgi:hypothetical protein|nr:hypothetical protein [Nitrososphaerota archaeon]MDG6936525.1 hypothetical protein [Nitrososphaerota archaeon]MDG6945000.1 hypothetical protein [Nitrososphaerota archaeon]
MNAKVIPVMLILLAMAVPAYTAYAQGSSSQLGTVISSTMHGIQVAESSVPSGTQAGIMLGQALTYLKEAQTLYNEGNYTGAQYYFSLAMNMSYDSVVTAGGKPFSVPPGTNVSVEQAKDYAGRLITESGSISNSTFRSAVQANITRAEQLLNEGNFTQARKLLGNTNAMIQQYAKGEFARNFETSFAPKLLMKAQELNLSSELNQTLFQEIGSMQFQGVGQIMKYMRDYNSMLAGNFTMPSGTIGIYDGRVYMVMPYSLQVVGIGNETFIESVQFMHHGMGMMRFNARVIGEVNSSYAVSYVLLHNGTEITVFPPSSFSSPFSITLYDVGNMSSMPTGTIVQYRQGAIQQFNFRNEFGN